MGRCGEEVNDRRPSSPYSAEACLIHHTTGLHACARARIKSQLSPPALLTLSSVGLALGGKEPQWTLRVPEAIRHLPSALGIVII